ncbi:MAG: ABC transporter permease [Armatimonadota bacterium]
MNLLEAARSAKLSLFDNKTRSLLTMLGVIIGVAAVIIVVAIGEGLKADTVDRIQSMGSNFLTIRGGGSRRPGPSSRPGRITDEDAEALKKSLTNIKAFAPTVTSNVAAKYRNITHSTSLSGSTPDWAIANAYEVAHGRFFDQHDDKSRARVVCIGHEVAQELFYGRPLIGETIRVDGIPFTVIGILKEKGGGWGNPDDQVVMPISTARQRIVGNSDPSRIYVSAKTAGDVASVKKQIEQILDRRHRVTEETRDYRIHDQAEILETVSETTRQITLFIAGIALVSLIVGGVGIMNIMLVSVTERTREIGVRKAVGARQGDILAQFLIESVMLSVLGGLIGMLIGFAGSAALGDALGWATVVPLWSVLVSVLFSGAVGVFFGWYPARKAAMLDPIECLRYE